MQLQRIVEQEERVKNKALKQLEKEKTRASQKQKGKRTEQSVSRSLEMLTLLILLY
jgi:hypothetical protein